MGSVSAASAAPQGGDSAPAPAVVDPASQRPLVQLRAIPAGTAPPEIDGHLDEPAWDAARRIGDLTQVLPIEGAAMPHRTDVLITYDADYLYVGLKAHDDPEEVRARQMDRDAFVRYDDVIELWLDPFASERFAYWFQVTPGGSLGDALIADNGTSFNKAWDGIWYGASRVTDDGWVAELAFPVKTLSFDPDAPWWGFNVRRRRVAGGEVGRWASPTNAYRFFQVSEGGRLGGIEGLRQGVGLDVVPYAKYEARRGSSERSFESLWDAGATVRWRPSALSTLLVTTNTDFAETEVDTRQINTNRFPLFFPERRDFFLEDAGVFLFGAPSNRSRLVPFFSRRIGLSSDGEVVPIQAGVKLTGRFGDWTVGALDTYLDGLGAQAPVGSDPGREALSPQNLGVVRVQRSLGEAQQLGMIFTTGDPGGDSGRSTVGMDATLGSTRFFGEGASGFVWPYLLASLGDGTEEAEGVAFGIDAQAQTRNWSHELRASRIDEDFSPALGFVRRTGFDEYAGASQYTWRASDESAPLRQLSAGVEASIVRDRAGSEDGWTVPVTLFDAQFWSQDSVDVTVTRRGETIDDAFDLGDTAVVAPGDYVDTRTRARFVSNDNRLYGLEASYEIGDFYGGTIRRLRAEPIVIPSKHLTVGLSYEDVEIEVGDPGRLHTQLYGLRADVTIDPFTTWFNFVQYDTDSNDLAAQSRVRWILEPGTELFVVGLFGFSKEDHRASFVTRDQSLAVKLEVTWRF